MEVATVTFVEIAEIPIAAGIVIAELVFLPGSLRSRCLQIRKKHKPRDHHQHNHNALEHDVNEIVEGFVWEAEFHGELFLAEFTHQSLFRLAPLSATDERLADARITNGTTRTPKRHRPASILIRAALFGHKALVALDIAPRFNRIGADHIAKYSAHKGNEGCVCWDR